MTTLQSALLTGLLVTVISCSAGHEEYHHETIGHSHDGASHSATAKPGANVRFETELREPLSPGDAGALEVTMIEGHSSGIMTVTASAGEGLDMLTTIDEATFDVADGDTHSWTVYFDTETEGKYYLNLRASVKTPIGRLTRSYAAPIIVGDPDAKTKRATNGKTSPNNGKVMMEAVETIRQ
ncbi:MAG: hypothetical protein AAFV54_01000 [Pseudomonadota bacterium]